jgi:hypothetical protein
MHTLEFSVARVVFAVGTLCALLGGAHAQTPPRMPAQQPPNSSGNFSVLDCNKLKVKISLGIADDQDRAMYSLCIGDGPNNKGIAPGVETYMPKEYLEPPTIEELLRSKTSGII